MSVLKIERPNQRQFLFIPMEGTKSNPMIAIPLYKLERGELDQMVRSILADGGVTQESEVQSIIDAVEQSYEARIKVARAKAELRRLMALRAQGLSLMQRGFRKWSECFFPAVTQFKKPELKTE